MTGQTAGHTSSWPTLSTEQLAAYLHRVGLPDRPEANLDGLASLHQAHACTIAFENINPFLGLAVSTKPQQAFAKLVTEGRGGYCFEHNSLFAAVLATLGFSFATLGARVCFHRPGDQPRTHMLLRVSVGQELYLADVGFGAAGLLRPISDLPDQSVHQQPGGRRFRLSQKAALTTLEAFLDGQWEPLYRFTLEEQLPIDYLVANHYVSTHPESVFVKNLTVQLQGLERQWSWDGRELVTRVQGSEAERQTIPLDRLEAMLASPFGLNLPVELLARLRDRLQQNS